MSQKHARGVGLQGPRGTWGAGQGQKDSDRRDGWWRPGGVDACPGGQAIQDRKRSWVIGCKKISAAQLKGGGWGRGKDAEGDWKRSSKQLNGGVGFI